MRLNDGEQILKTRDDQAPIRLELATDPSETEKRFKVENCRECAWAKADEEFGPEKLRPRIEPWLTALVQSEHLSVLIGSGLTHAVHQMATHKALAGLGTIKFHIFDDQIAKETKRIAEAAGREDGNFEDQMRAATELLRGLEILEPIVREDESAPPPVTALREELEAVLGSFANSILAGERNLLLARTAKREEAFNYLISFLMSFASRSGTRERLHLFTTNYDRYIEAGAEVAGLRLIDRFVGSLAPVFRASRLDVDLHYNPPGIRGEPRYLEGVARFTKLHGSVDWVDFARVIRRFGLPFGAQNTEPYFAAPGLEGADAMQLMIYPNAAKDRETASHPYVELFRDFAAAICRPNNTLVCYGSSFGDEHINRVIEDMLTIPSTHLVVISFSDPLGRIMSTYERLGRHAQITLLLGDHLGDLRTLVDRYLPKPAIDRTTLRMAELLKARWSAGQGESEAGSSSTTDDGGSTP